VPSLEFQCVLCLFNILLNKTTWNRSSFGLRTFRVTIGLQERIEFVNRGSTVFAYVRLTHTCKYIILYKATCFNFQKVIVRPFLERKTKIYSVGVHMGSLLHVLWKQLKIRLECKAKLMLELS
jgi:hypothetical protein